ncbi:MAG TPA: MFS transporter [Planctomycetaceae bacterium]|nr:MFS transporter [Planctomycetaceae bacterium]
MSAPAQEIAPELTHRQRYLVLVASFLGWMFAGLEIALFVLIHRPAMVSLMTASGATTIDEGTVQQWFAWYQAAFLFGAASGGWWFGILGDRLGRTRSLSLSILCYSVFTGISYWATSPVELLVWRFLACHGIGGAWPNTVALVAEAWPAASRPFLAGLLGTAANVGQVSIGLIGLGWEVTPASWRWVLVVGALPGLLGAWCWHGVPESRKWLAARNARMNSASPLRELFQPPLRSRTLIGILLGAVPVMGTAANAQWVVPWTDQVAAQKSAAAAEGTIVKKPDAKSKAKAQISRSGGAVIGSLIGGMLATLLGRRTTYFVISLLSLAASLIVFGTLQPGHPWFYTATFLFGLVGVIYFGWLPLYLPELFPTRVRATGTGISFNTGRSLAACVTLGTAAFVGWFGGNYAKIGLWTSTIYLAGMIIILFAPRTDASSLKE